MTLWPWGDPVETRIPTTDWPDPWTLKGHVGAHRSVYEEETLPAVIVTAMLRGDFRTECNMDGCWYWRDWDTMAEAEADCDKHAKRKHGLNGWGSTARLRCHCGSLVPASPVAASRWAGYPSRRDDRLWS